MQKYFNNLTIKVMLTFSALVPLISFAIIFGILYFSTERAKTSNEWVEHTYEVIDKIDYTLLNVVNMETGYRGFMITNNDGFLEPYEGGIEAVKQSLSNLLTLTADNKTQTQRFLEIEAKLESWVTNVLQPGINLSKNNGNTIEYVNSGTGKQYVDSIRQILAAAKSDEIVLKSERSQAFSNAERDTLMYTAAIILIFGFIGFLISHLISSYIRTNIATVVKGMLKLEQGDLSYKVPNDQGKNELSQLGKSYNKTQDKLRLLISDINSITKELLTASSDLASSASQTSKGAIKQTEQLELTATAMLEMTATVTEVAQNTISAADAAIKADEYSDSGINVVKVMNNDITVLSDDITQVSDVISTLAQETKNINTILDTIKGIATQTNLLALNAAIEAARAGEQGKGFAVVAEEVRNLASSTQGSASEISEMIEKLQIETSNAVSKMEQNLLSANNAVQKTEAAQDSLNDIKTAVNLIQNMSHQIAAAAEEQQTTSNEINKNINEVYDAAKDATNQSNLTTQLSENLTTISKSLNEKLGTFTMQN
ncbi:MAG: methyl-accepting chemotaxis protein [Photobacterium frigidiphilum]|uniref:methyl-accepting chemotaxis protein n=1 Tax=Photobacterium frigidiphilum TaxID=264736 RepID=UPI00300137EC